VNALLAIGCAALVLGFRSSSALASAYGIAVTLTMLATTILFYFAAQRLWMWPAWKAGTFCAVFGVIELSFFGANALKIVHGGWFPLVAGAAVFVVMTTWKKGRKLLRARLPSMMPLDDFIASISLAGTLAEENRIHRSPGTAVFLAADPEATPNALVKNVRHNQILHARNVVLTVLTDRSRPHVPGDERVEVSDRGEGFYRVVARFGFMEKPLMSEVIRAAAEKGFAMNAERATFFVGRERIIPTPKQGMALWREHLFVFLTKHSENAADFFQLPPDSVYEVSHVIEM
jgi:KUP system potassium uptake protein